MKKSFTPSLFIEGMETYVCDVEAKKLDVTSIEVTANSRREAVIKAREVINIKFPKKEYEVVEVRIKTDTGKFEIEKFNPDHPEDEYTKIKKEMEKKR